MPRPAMYEFSVLNITLQPHSPELYISLFDDVFSQKPAISKKYYRDDHISLKVIDKIISDDNKIEAIYGYIQKYTIINTDSWYDKEKDSKAPQGEEPDYDLSRFSPYYDSFDFIFLPNGHRMFVLTKLKEKTLSISRAADAIRRIFNIEWIVEKYNEVSVNVETDSSTIERILSIDKLEKLFINVSLDNDDDNFDLKDNVLTKMRAQGVRKETRSLVGEKNQSIKPDEETKAFMELSLSNGYTIAHGKKNGVKVTEKTKDYPIHESKPIDLSLYDIKDALFDYAKRTISYLRTRQNR